MKILERRIQVFVLRCRNVPFRISGVARAEIDRVQPSSVLYPQSLGSSGDPPAAISAVRPGGIQNELYIAKLHPGRQKIFKGPAIPMDIAVRALVISVSDSACGLVWILLDAQGGLKTNCPGLKFVQTSAHRCREASNRSG